MFMDLFVSPGRGRVSTLSAVFSWHLFAQNKKILWLQYKMLFLRPEGWLRPVCVVISKSAIAPGEGLATQGRVFPF